MSSTCVRVCCQQGCHGWLVVARPSPHTSRVNGPHSARGKRRPICVRLVGHVTCDREAEEKNPVRFQLRLVFFAGQWLLPRPIPSSRRPMCTGIEWVSPFFVWCLLVISIPGLCTLQGCHGRPAVARPSTHPSSGNDGGHPNACERRLVRVRACDHVSWLVPTNPMLVVVFLKGEQRVCDLLQDDRSRLAHGRRDRHITDLCTICM